MVVGNGLMGQTFSNYKLNSKILIFASGVSKSSTNVSQEYEREKQLFLDVIRKHPNKKTIYFSTCSIYDSSSLNRPYVKHKLEMEILVKRHCKDYIIFRVSNVVGKTGNPNTLINYFVNAVVNSININVWANAQRNIIGIDDVKFIVDSKINSGAKNRIINVAVRKSEFVIDILFQVERFLQKTSVSEIIDKGCKLDIDTTDIKDELSVIESKKGEGLQYVYSLLNKYY
jgi:nucleoside-diphosphate-sugar epimerase